MPTHTHTHMHIHSGTSMQMDMYPNDTHDTRSVMLSLTEIYIFLLCTLFLRFAMLFLLLDSLYIRVLLLLFLCVFASSSFSFFLPACSLACLLCDNLNFMLVSKTTICIYICCCSVSLFLFPSIHYWAAISRTIIITIHTTYKVVTHRMYISHVYILFTLFSLFANYVIDFFLLSSLLTFLWTTIFFYFCFGK